MKSRILSGVLAITVLLTLFCGCEENENLPDSSNLSSAVLLEQANEYGTAISDGVKKVNMPTCVNQGECIMSAVTVDETRSILLIQSESDMLKKAQRKVVLYDLIGEKSIKEYTFESYEPTMLECEGGVYITAIVDAPDATEALPFKQPMITVLDNNLNVVKEVDFSTVGKNTETVTAKMSYDKTKIAYLIDGSIYTFDIDSSPDNAECLYSVVTKKGMTSISDFNFLKNCKEIVFTGMFHNGSRTVGGKGHCSVDKSGNGQGENKKLDKLIVGGNNVLYIDEASSYGGSSTGVVELYNNELSKTDYITLEKKNESSAALLSNNGKYIISSLDVGKNAVKFTVYDASTYKKINEYEYTGSADNLFYEIVCADDTIGKILVNMSDNSDSFLLEIDMIKGETK